MADETVEQFLRNAEKEIRLVAEIDGKFAPVGPLTVERSEFAGLLRLARRLADKVSPQL